ncbi:MAG: nucleotidyltransferase domain-containing protein [Clostridiales bacterium]|nr:nucleotidyltransferase domain-containing protein [Clostridiales bacterium]
MTIKELRKEKGMTQSECADFLHIPTRTYKRYESDDSRVNPMKYEYIISRLREYGLIDEDHGKLTIEQIREICGEVFKEYSVEYAYVFGSYAKGTATEKSDVDILISVPTDGLKFFELVEVLREKLKKRVDLLDEGQLENNTALTHEILKYGVKIYG